jgi:hypothetical protein
MSTTVLRTVGIHEAISGIKLFVPQHIRWEKTHICLVPDNIQIKLSRLKWKHNCLHLTGICVGIPQVLKEFTNLCNYRISNTGITVVTNSMQY